MIRKIMISALAAVAMASAGVAVAKPGNAKGPKAAKVAKAAKPGATMRAQGRLNSQGPANASARGIERSSVNSVLKGSTVVAGPLTGLDGGDTVHATVDGSLQPVGTVERIVPDTDGRVRNVLVRLSDGRVVPLDPASLSDSSGQWTTDSLKPGARGR